MIEAGLSPASLRRTIASRAFGNHAIASLSRSIVLTHHHHHHPPPLAINNNSAAARSPRCLPIARTLSLAARTAGTSRVLARPPNDSPRILVPLHQRLRHEHIHRVQQHLPTL